MILDSANGTSNARTSTPPSAPRWTGKAIHAPPNLRLPLSSATPTLRRDPKGTKQTTNHNASAGDSKQDVNTPVKTFLSSNITPRSGSRKTRVESASSTPRSTPERTPAIARPASMIEGRHWPSGETYKAYISGTSGAHTSRPERARSVASDLQYPTRTGPAGSTQEEDSGIASPDNPPKFFHANDAKPRLQTKPQSQSARLQPKSAGIQQINDAYKNDTSALTASPESGDEHPKFFYADRMPEATTPPPRFANGIVSARPPLQTIFSSYQTPSSPVPRPPSPLKEEILPISRKSSLSKPSPRRHTRLVSNGCSDIKAPDGFVKGQTGPSRRSSINDPSRRKSRPQSPHTASFGFAPSRRASLAISDEGQDSGPSIPQGLMPAGPPPSEVSATTSPEPVRPQSPSKPTPGQSKLDHLNELAANARRERKVLDLEISNSSLLAINRTLETEMRKQKAELRQFRRLRSSGRFPFSTFRASSRLSMPSTNDELSPTSSADEDELDDDRFSNASSGTSDDTSFPDSTSLSPTLRNSSIPVAKKRRTRSFKVDLAGQRVLLLDSQRLNQALKRCLGRTDELIADGKKALDYMVDTGDAANLGPRVLGPDGRDGEYEMGRGLLSPGLDERLENPWDRSRSLGDGWHLPEPNHLELETQNPEDVEGDMPAPYEESVAEDIDDGLGKRTGQGVSSDRQDELEAGVHANLDAPFITAGLIPGPEVPMSEHLPINNLFPAASNAPESQIIPYEDPGIDTGGETSTIEDDGSESSQDTVEHSMTLPSTHLTDGTSKGNAKIAIETLHAESSDTESTTSEAPAVGSPGKGLGGFLRMVGGSWGI
ncbi:MAG: hypothetical protein Q9226_007157 [Calogaya cf. arnoldii]